MSAVLAGARREVLGFFRRRESFWLLAGLGAGCVLPLAVVAFGPGIAGRGAAEAFARTEVGFAAEVVHNYACVVEAVVVSSSPGEVQLLDPQTMRTVDLRTPPGFKLEGRETLGVLKREGRLMIAR